MEDEYDREVLFDNIADRVRHDQRVEVSMRDQHWWAKLIAPHEHTACSSCGEPLTIAHASGGNQLCTRCRKRALH